MYQRSRLSVVPNLREIIFGLEDALVSTVGTLTGIAIGTHSTYVVILSGLVLLASEATSMAAGSYLSSKEVIEASHPHRRKDEDGSNPLRAGIVMFVSYLLGGLLPLGSYFFLPLSIALMTSVILTVIGLFALGVWSSRFTKRVWWRSGLEMMGVSGAAVVIGYGIGRLVSVYFGIEMPTV